ncbi:hypothetical protein J132_00851 [Termitomyces sp. J132]|nr:hypothetical protein J132_00851 [Termitomyces sp. J132]
MSSPSIPVVSPALLLSDLDKVVVYDSGGEEFEHWRHTSARDWSLICGGGGGFPGGPKVDQVLSHVAKGGEHGAVCREGGVFAGWSGKGGVLGSDSWEALSLPVLGGGTRQEATWARAISGASGVSPVFSYPGHSLGMVEALTTLLAAWEGELRWAREDHDVAQMEKEAMERERNTLVRMAMEQALEVRGLQEHLMQMEGQPTGKAEGWGQVPGGDVLWAELEAARWREDWLANEAASGLGVGALGPPRWCLHGVHVNSGWVDAGVHGSAPGVAAGDGMIGEVAGGASAMQCGGLGVVVGGGG